MLKILNNLDAEYASVFLQKKLINHLHWGEKRDFRYRDSLKETSYSSHYKGDIVSKIQRVYLVWKSKRKTVRGYIFLCKGRKSIWNFGIMHQVPKEYFVNVIKGKN